MNYAIILSGGTGSRMNMPGTIKQYVLVMDKPVLIYTLERFEKCPSIDCIVIVAAKEWREQISSWLSQFGIFKFSAFADPGIQRQSSILNGLKKCMELSESSNDVVIIHDAARPLVSEDLITNCLRTAMEFGGCMPVIRVSDTIYQSSNGTSIQGLLDRDSLFAGQSPEAFQLKQYYELNKSVSGKELNGYKGTSEIAIRHGIDVHIIPGEDGNFKITTQQDLERFRLICKEKRGCTE